MYVKLMSNGLWPIEIALFKRATKQKKNEDAVWCLRACVNAILPVQTAPQNQAPPGTQGPQSARTVA